MDVNELRPSMCSLFACGGVCRVCVSLLCCSRDDIAIQRSRFVFIQTIMSETTPCRRRIILTWHLICTMYIVYALVCTSKKKVSADDCLYFVYTLHPARAESGLVMADHAARELEGMRAWNITNPHQSTSRRTYVCMYVCAPSRLQKKEIVSKKSTTLSAKASATRGKARPPCCRARDRVRSVPRCEWNGETQSKGATR